MAGYVKSIVDYSGTDSVLVDVECHITNGLPAVIIIGQASKAVDEAKDRLRAGFANSNIQFPKKRVTINLSPADVPKDATSLDLAIGVSVLVESGQIDNTGVSSFIFLGELGLDGSLNPVRGLIGRILEAKNMGINRFYIPASSTAQAMLIPGIMIKAARNFREVYLDLAGTAPLKEVNSGTGKISRLLSDDDSTDFSEISGQPIAKRALEIAAAGHHNILLHGPPGTGKTMLARAMCGILPDLEHSEVLEITHLHSLAGVGQTKIASRRPFRAPHHTISTTALVGGGSKPKPGEASLAHRGVLFLDELPEFSQGSLEALRQPLEDKFVNIARIKDSATYPADFILVATQNPCPCGYYGSDRPCSCSAASIARYRKKLSGPIMDRIDLHLAVNNINHSKILERRVSENENGKIKNRVNLAYKQQIKRFGKARFNSSMTNKEIRDLSKLSLESKSLLDQASEKLGMSARSYIRTVKVSRTIADLEQSDQIEPRHISEALQYRQQVSL